MRIFLLVTLMLLSFSCSKKHDEGQKYVLEEFTKILDSSGAVVDKKVTAINFSDYGPGVGKINSKALEYKSLGFYAIEFETSEQAKEEAVRLNQYYSRNWLFDRTEGEPILEDFVILTFNATNPVKKIPRKPKKAPEHGGAHGESHAAPAHEKEAPAPAAHH